MKKFLKIITITFLLFTVFAWGFIVGGEQAKDSRLPAIGGKVTDKGDLPDYLSKDANFNLFWEVWDIVQKNYVDGPIPETQLLYGAIAGEVAALEDPYSVFLNPEIAKKFAQELSSEFEGIGAEISIKNNFLTVVAPLPESPAEKAGLKSGDRIYAIDGQDTAYLTLNEAVGIIRGEAGTKVILTVARGEGGEVKDLDIEIIRDKIHFDTVKWEMRDDGILYMEISHFNNDTETLFNKAVSDNIGKDIKGIVLDLRGNPGGFLDVAVNMAGKWIRKGDPVVFEKFSETRQNPYRSNGRAELSGIPTVALVNGGSASASEIIAGALQDYSLATIVGTQTFGKGSVQDLRELSDGSQLKLTVAKWLTPLERIIEGEGITPDIQVELTDEDYNNDKDPQLDKAIELLGK